MKLAVNYSPQAADLLRRGRVHVDLFKCPDWPELIRDARQDGPVYVHFPLVAGGATLKETDWGALEALLSETETAFVNVHLEARADLFALPVNTNDPNHVAQVTEVLINDVSLVAERFGPERVIAENITYRGFRSQVMRPSALPEVVRAVTGETGCGFLLDLSHARISAHYLSVEEPGVELWGYLDALPVGRLRELHVTGIHYQNDKLTDHLALTADDWGALEGVLGRIRSGAWRTPETVAFEYGGLGPTFAWRSDPAVLAEQLPRLYELVYFGKEAKASRGA